MKKLNKKGMTIAELVVSFLLVGVAVVYFYNTVDTVYKVYSETRVDTQEFVDKNYAMRMIDAANKQGKVISTDLLKSLGVKTELAQGYNWEIDDNVIFEKHTSDLLPTLYFARTPLIDNNGNKYYHIKDMDSIILSKQAKKVIFEYAASDVKSSIYVNGSYYGFGFKADSCEPKTIDKIIFSCKNLEGMLNIEVSGQIDKIEFSVSSGEPNIKAYVKKIIY